MLWYKFLVVKKMRAAEVKEASSYQVQVLGCEEDELQKCQAKSTALDHCAESEVPQSGLAAHLLASLVQQPTALLYPSLSS
ncbi:hypothetical protein Dimus_004392 [Dionaea muscipula]